MKRKFPIIVVLAIAFTFMLASCGEPSNFEEYIKNNEEISEELEVYCFQGMDVDVSGNTITFTYEYDETFDETTAALMTKELNNALKGNAENFTSIKNRYIEKTGFEDLTVVITYVDGEGNELCTGKY